VLGHCLDAIGLPRPIPGHQLTGFGCAVVRAAQPAVAADSFVRSAGTVRSGLSESHPLIPPPPWTAGTLCNACSTGRAAVAVGVKGCQLFARIHSYRLPVASWSSNCRAALEPVPTPAPEDLAPVVRPGPSGLAVPPGPLPPPRGGGIGIGTGQTDTMDLFRRKFITKRRSIRRPLKFGFSFGGVLLRVHGWYGL
jgi:hypothetical protein